MVKKKVIPATKKLGKELLKEASPEHKLRVCAYARVSTDTEEQLESFNAQIGRYTRIIKEDHKDDWEFAGIFADTESGTSIEKREEFQDMMDKCREGLIDLILVKQMSRFGRNTINTLQAIYELRNLGVEVYFETDELYASNSKLDFMLTMYSALAQEESRQQSVRVSAGIHERMESGNIAGRVQPILGYRKDNNKKIYIYEPEAVFIRMIFLMYACDINMHDVSRWLERDFPNKGKKASYRTTLYADVLKNPRYRGDVILQKTFKTCYVNGLIKRNKGEKPIYIYENYHPNIVPKSFFDYVQEKRENHKITYQPATFNQLIFCGCCTRNMNSVTRNRKTKRDSYYSCNVFRHRSGMYCDAPYYDRYLIDDIFTNIIKNLIDINKLRQKIKELLQLTIFTSLNSRKKYELLDLKTKLASQTAEMKKCEALAIENPSIVDDEDYKSKVKSIKDQMLQLEKQIRVVNKVNHTTNKQDVINKKLDKYLSQPVSYTLLAELHHIKLIVMPAYKLVLVKHRTKVVDNEFRKRIRDILKKISDESFVNSIFVRHNGQIIDYSIAIVKI